MRNQADSASLHFDGKIIAFPYSEPETPRVRRTRASLIPGSAHGRLHIGDPETTFGLVDRAASEGEFPVALSTLGTSPILVSNSSKLNSDSMSGISMNRQLAFFGIALVSCGYGIDSEVD